MVTALQDGACVVCLQPYAVGDPLGLLVDGWAHLDCYDLAQWVFRDLRGDDDGE